jgi:hypothetical protein
MIPPYIRENIEYGPMMPRFEVLDYNNLGYLSVVFASDVKELCIKYIQETIPTLN